MAGDAEFLLGLDLGGQAVAVPAEAPLDPSAAHRLVARDGVLDEAGQQVAVVREPVGERRAVVEDEFVVAGHARVALFDRALERRRLLPNGQHVLFECRKVRLRVDGWIRHASMLPSTIAATDGGSAPIVECPSSQDASGLRSSSNVKRKSSVRRADGVASSRRSNPAPTGVGSSTLVVHREQRTVVVGRIASRPRRPTRRRSRSTITSRSLRSGRGPRRVSPESSIVGAAASGVAPSTSPVGRRVDLARRQRRRMPTTAVGARRRARRDPVGDGDEFGRRVAHPATLGDEELLEVIDVGLEEVAASLEGVDLAGGQQRSDLARRDGPRHGPRRASPRPSRESSRGSSPLRRWRSRPPSPLRLAPRRSGNRRCVGPARACG